MGVVKWFSVGAWAVLGLGCGLLLGGCGGHDSRLVRELGGGETLNFTGPAMGGLFQISLVTVDGDMQALVEAAMEEARRIEDLVNAWSEASTLSVWNQQSREAEAGVLEMDVELAQLVSRGLRMAEKSGGAFDPTVAVVLREMGFYGSELKPKADQQQRDRWQALTGFERVRVLEGGLVERDVRGLELDLSALAKGYAAERMADVLRAGGVRTALIGAGASSKVTFGPGPGGHGWPLELPHPDGPITLWLMDEALATSGQSSITLNGAAGGGSHILDPRNLEPVVHRTEMVVVRGANGADCDMLSTALLVLGVDGWGTAGGDLAPGHELWFYSTSETGPEVIHLEARGSIGD